MKRIDRWLLRQLIRRNPALATDAGLPEALAGARASGGMTRAQLADALDQDVEWVLAFDLGVIDPSLSAVRYYAYAAGVMVGHTVVTAPPAEGVQQ